MICAKCEEEKTEDQFGNDGSRKVGKYPYCRVCAIDHQKKMRLKRQLKQEMRVYRQDPERKALFEQGLKRCKTCKETKSLEEFDIFKSTHIDGRTARCKICRSLDKKIAYKLNDRKRNERLLRMYGISLEEYNIMFDQQLGLCAICQLSSHEHLCVDHDHLTGEIRALLCKDCNNSIGRMKDDPTRLRAAANYVEMYNNRLR